MSSGDRAAERDLETGPQLSALASGTVDEQAVLAICVDDGPSAASTLKAGVHVRDPS